MISAEATKKRLDEKINQIVTELIPSIMDQINKAVDNHQSSTEILIDNLNLGYKIRSKLQEAKYTVEYERSSRRRSKPYQLTVSWGEKDNNSNLSTIDPLYITTVPEKVKTLVTAEEIAKLLIKKEKEQFSIVYCDVEKKIMTAMKNNCHNTVIGFKKNIIRNKVEKKLIEQKFLAGSYYDDEFDEPLRLRVSWITDQETALINTQSIEQDDKCEDNCPATQSEILPKEENKMCY